MTQLATESEANVQQSKRWKMSFDDFLTWDGDGNPDRRVEWINGEAVELVSVSDRHTDIVGLLLAVFRLACDSKRIGRVLFEPFVMRAEESGNGRSPDAFIVRTQNLGRIDGLYLKGPADLVVEVVSPSSTKTDYFVKLAEYQRAGVPEYWIIDPIGKRTTFLLLDDRGQYREADLDHSGRFASPGLDGLPVDPKWFHQEELPLTLDILKEWGLV